MKTCDMEYEALLAQEEQGRVEIIEVESLGGIDGQD